MNKEIHSENYQTPKIELSLRKYGTAEIHILSYYDTIDQLPLRPVVFNTGTTSYHLSKYLVKLLSPVSQSEYIVKNSKEFIQKFENVVPLGSNSKLFSFDMSS